MMVTLRMTISMLAKKHFLPTTLDQNFCPAALKFLDEAVFRGRIGKC